jgi:hypothetical protein
VKSSRSSATRVALFTASSLSAVALATPAAAQETMVEDAPSIVINNGYNPNTPVASGGSLDTGVTGVGSDARARPYA